MGIIKASKLVFDYVRRDEEENIEEVSRAVDGMDLKTEKGTFVAILGYNGSGKPIFAKQINGTLTSTEGTVWTSGMNTSDDEQIWEIRKKARMVLQNPDNQIIGGAMEEDVGFGLGNIGISTDEVRRRVDESLGAVGMMTYRYRSPNKLSGGQKQRVAIAGMMATRPECIILGELAAMLDPDGRKGVVKTVRVPNRKGGTTMLLTAHYMEEVVHTSRVIAMDNGKVVMDRTPREIFPKVKELKGYQMDVPQVTELAHELREDGLDIPEGILTRRKPLDSLLPLLMKCFPKRVILETGEKHVN